MHCQQRKLQVIYARARMFAEFEHLLADLAIGGDTAHSSHEAHADVMTSRDGELPVAEIQFIDHYVRLNLCFYCHCNGV